MCSIATMAEYNEKKKWLDEIANIFPDISWWLTSWDAMKYHMFTAFRCFGYLNITLGESGNAMLKHCTQLWLLEAVWDATSTMITQIHELNSFLAQVTSSSSKGPCFLTLDRANRTTQVYAAKAYAHEFSNKHAHSEAIEENTNPQVYVPSDDARHKPVKSKTGIQGIFVQKKKQKKVAVNKNMHVGLGKAIKGSQSYSCTGRHAN